MVYGAALEKRECSYPYLPLASILSLPHPGDTHFYIWHSLSIFEGAKQFVGKMSAKQRPSKEASWLMSKTYTTCVPGMHPRNEEEMLPGMHQECPSGIRKEHSSSLLIW